MRSEANAVGERTKLAARESWLPRRVLVRHGVENATTKMIAREAKVKVRTNYLHFASSDEVYLSLRAERNELGPLSRRGEATRSVATRRMRSWRKFGEAFTPDMRRTNGIYK